MTAETAEESLALIEEHGHWPSTGDPEVDFIRRYASDVATLLRKIDPGAVVAAVSALYAAWQNGKVVLFCGNGGSGASCSHIVNDFQKGCGLKAICLSDCTPLLSAYANDLAWSVAFDKMAEVWAEPGGVLVALSGSGNSMNVLRAVDLAQSSQMQTVALSGFDGGLLKDAAGISLHVATDSMQQAEDAHMVLLHLLYLGLKRRIEAAQ